jgi:hypothetical protein
MVARWIFDFIMIRCISGLPPPRVVGDSPDRP